MLGIAVCATYATGAMALLDGLEAGSRSVLGRLDTGPFLAYRGAFPHFEPFALDGGVQGSYRPGWLRPAHLVTNTSSVPVRLLAFAGTGDLSFGRVPNPGEMLLGAPLSQELGLAPDDGLTLRTDGGVVEVVVAGPWEADLDLPSTWVLTSEADLRRLAPWEEGRYDLVFAAQREDAVRLAGDGYTVQALVSVTDFFDAALQEARQIVGGLIGVSAVAIAAVAYSLLSLEIRYRQGEIRTLRAIGLGGRGLGRLYGLQLAFIVAGGTALGMAAGLVAAHGLVSFAPLFGLPTVIRPHVSLWGLLLPLTASLGAGMAGGGTGLWLHLRRLNHAPHR